MSIDIRQPNISAGNTVEQMLQMRSYLYQLAEQLNWAFSTIDGGSNTGETAVEIAAALKAVKQDPTEVFAGIKGLIIKSADIVNAYYEQINTRLEGQYVSESDFGTYKQETSMELQENNNGITQLFQNTQTISETVNELYNAQIGTNAYIKTGLLYEDSTGTPVYGLEIGQTNDVQGEQVFAKFARFSSDRLSFYDRNDTEIAYISDYKLYITNAEITGSLRLLNKFKIYYANGLAFQWIGGGE